MSIKSPDEAAQRLAVLGYVFESACERMADGTWSEDDSALALLISDFRNLSQGCKDVQRYLWDIQKTRLGILAERPKINVHDPLACRRFRKARTYTNWCEIDGIRYHASQDGGCNSNWHFFESGDQVEFKDPIKGLVRCTVRIHKTSYMVGIERLERRTAFVIVARKDVRVTEAPAMRLIRRK